MTVNSTEEKIRHSCKKLKKNGLLFFDMKRGQKLTRFYMPGYLMAENEHRPNIKRFVTPEYVQKNEILFRSNRPKSAKLSDVKNDFPMSDEALNQDEQDIYNKEKPTISDVPYIEREIYKEIEHPAFSNIPKTAFKDLFTLYERSWLLEKLRALAARSEQKGYKPFSKERLLAMLAEDWAKDRPGNDFKRDNLDFEQKQRKREEAEKEGQVGPCPPELKADLYEKLGQQNRN